MTKGDGPKGNGIGEGEGKRKGKEGRGNKGDGSNKEIQASRSNVRSTPPHCLAVFYHTGLLLFHTPFLDQCERHIDLLSFLLF